MPVPVIVVDPTDSVTVQVPAAGNPLRSMLPVATPQVGCMMTPTTGAVGVTGAAFITATPEATEVHVVIPSVTVKV